jgi:hypothetical protein
MEENKNKGGRPLKFQSVEELQAKIDQYFKSCWRQKIDMWGNPIFAKDKDGKKTDEPVMVQFIPYTITGLAVALDTYRDVLLDYESGKYDDPEKADDLNDQFSNTIKRAKERCHGYAEESLFIGKNPTGAIFNLKNNYGWQDKTVVETDPKDSGGIMDKLQEIDGKLSKQAVVESPKPTDQPS